MALPVDEVHGAVVLNLDLGEKVDVHHQVAGAEAVLGKLNEEAVEGVLVPVVAGLLVGEFAVLLGNHLRVGAAAERVVPADGIGGDADEDASHVGVEDGSGSKARDVLGLEGVGQVEALGEEVGVKEDGAHVGTVGERGERERGTALEDVGPGGVAGEGFGPEDFFRHVSQTLSHSSREAGTR